MVHDADQCPTPVLFVNPTRRQIWWGVLPGAILTVILLVNPALPTWPKLAMAALLVAVAGSAWVSSRSRILVDEAGIRAWTNGGRQLRLRWSEIDRFEAVVGWSSSLRARVTSGRQRRLMQFAGRDSRITAENVASLFEDYRDRFAGPKDETAVHV